MPHRRIELIADKLELDKLDSVLDEANAFDRYQVVVEEDGPDRFIFVVDESQTESVVDAIQDRYGEADGFKLIIHELSALWPRPEKKHGQEGDTLSIGNRRISREELLDDLAPGSHVSAVYVGQVLISCVVASVGMMRDNVTMVIAAMVIAPLLLPNMAMSLGTTLGDLKLVRRSAVASAVGLAAGFALALLVGLLFTFDPSVREIALRTRVHFSDLLVALSAGAAGALAVTTGVSANLIGVMVAVALVPPLVALGLLLGAGEMVAAGGAAILLMSNVVCVNLAGVGVFLIQGIRPNTWYEAAAARRATITAIICWIVLLGGLALLIWLAAPDKPFKN